MSTRSVPPSASICLNAKSPARAARFVRGVVQKSMPAGFRPYRVALLSSFSIDMVQDPLIAYGFTEGFDVEIYNPGYDQYHQDILSPNSGLYETKPDAIILAVEGRRWAPELYDGFLSEGFQQGQALADTIVARVGDLISTLRRHSAAPRAPSFDELSTASPARHP